MKGGRWYTFLLTPWIANAVSLCLAQGEQRPSREASWAASDPWQSTEWTLTWKKEPRLHRAWAPAVLATAAAPTASATTEGAASRRAMATSVTAHSLPTGGPSATKVSPPHHEAAAAPCSSLNQWLLIRTNRKFFIVRVIPLLGTNENRVMWGTINSCPDCENV